MLQSIKSERKKAFGIGFICVLTYVINYYIRNILSVLTPSMLSSGEYTNTYLALLASTYMIAYAAGQLLNGFLGDYLKAKVMVALGLGIAAAGLEIFAFSENDTLGIVCFAVIGVGLSMLRGPLVKVISENTLPNYARICCVFLSFASFSGPFLAGLAAMVFDWQQVFVFSGICALLMAASCFVVLTVFEKKHIINPISVQKGERRKIDLLCIFRQHNFIQYMFIGIVVEIAAASINFWMPTYFTQYLEVPEDTANMIFSAISLIRSFCPFLSLFIFRLFHERDMLIVRISFLSATALFGVMFFVENPVFNIILMTLALVCASISSATLWSIYIPSLGKSGKVSGANGILDCSGYIGASVFNSAIVPVMNAFGWSSVIISWGCIMLFGAIVTFFGKKNPEPDTTPDI